LDKYQIIAQKVALNPFACVSFATSILLILMSEQGDNWMHSMHVHFYVRCVCPFFWTCVWEDTHTHTVLPIRLRDRECNCNQKPRWCECCKYVSSLFFPCIFSCIKSGYILLLKSRLKWFQLETLVASDSREAEIQVLFFPFLLVCIATKLHVLELHLSLYLFPLWWYCLMWIFLFEFLLSNV
jgi:hypothetical protein